MNRTGLAVVLAAALATAPKAGRADGSAFYSFVGALIGVPVSLIFSLVVPRILRAIHGERYPTQTAIAVTLGGSLAADGLGLLIGWSLSDHPGDYWS